MRKEILLAVMLTAGQLLTTVFIRRRLGRERLIDRIRSAE